MRLHPAIVIVGFDRPRSIERLLRYLVLANYPNREIQLAISLDFSSSENGMETRKIAEEFVWPHGPKRVILQPEFLDLRNHVLACGDLTQQYGSIIVLEDDLSVSSEFYRYAVAALEFSLNHDSIAGVALYSQRTNTTALLPFMPLFDGADNFYLQIAASWGQAWHRSQWSQFRKWYDDLADRPENPLEQIPQSAPIPSNVANWRNSWLKYFIWYLAETNKYFHYPRVSYSTNHSDRGTHAANASKQWQVPLAMRCDEFRFSTPEESLAVYDSFYEVMPERLKKLCPLLSEYEFDVDLYGIKPRSLLKRPFVLTSRKISGQAKLSFHIERKPLEANFSLAGSQNNEHCFSLIEPEKMLDQSTIQISNLQTVRYFFNVVPIREIVKSSLGYFLQKTKVRIEAFVREKKRVSAK